MRKAYLFFLVIFLLPASLAYGETGKNFDTVTNPDGSVLWTSHYDRVLSPDWKWKNYILADSATEFRYTSSGIIFVYDKLSCHFKLYNPQDNTLEIDAYSFRLAIDSTNIPLSTCDITDVEQDTDEITFTIDYGRFLTHYRMNPIEGVEWTHEIDNDLGRDGTFTITETCQSCTPLDIDGGRIDFGGYTFDTKNEIHNTVKSSRADKGDYLVEYEKAVGDREKIIIDPAFGFSSGTVKRIVSTSTVSATCSTTAASDNVVETISKPTSAANDSCKYLTWYWDISAITDTVSVQHVNIKFDIDSVITAQDCTIMEMVEDPSSAGNQDILDDIIGGTTYLDSSWCSTTGNNQEIDLGGDAVTRLATDLADDEFAIGVFFSSLTRGGAVNSVGFSDMRLQVLYDNPGSVTDLTVTDERGTAIDLSWTAPTQTGGFPIIGYMVNYTTPQTENGDSITSIATADTGSTSTTYTVAGLTGETPYSFRVGVLTSGGSNATGNIANGTTAFDPTASFTPGTFNFTATGDDDRPIKFERNDISDTDLFLNITVDTDWDLACNFHYKFANINKTYTNIANTSLNAEEDVVGFRFDDVDNEIIDVLCWDQYTNASGNYLITQNDFPFLQNILDFRDGEFGTQGMFGAIDMITLVAVIIGMVGFNRKNESVGGVFLLFIMGGLAYFEIIAWPAVMTAGLVLVVIVVIGSTRKD